MASPQIKHFVVPVMADLAAEDALNRFLRGHQVLDVREEFVENGSSSLWCIAVRYAIGDGVDLQQAGAKRPRIDYKDELEPEAFARFAELRKRRKAIAEAEALPAFAVFTDEELAAIAVLDNPGLEELSKIKGIGEKKLARFGERILATDKEKFVREHLARLFKEPPLLALFDSVIDGYAPLMNLSGRGIGASPISAFSSPSPLVGEGWGEGYKRERMNQDVSLDFHHPHPSPPPSRGRESEGDRRRLKPDRLFSLTPVPGRAVPIGNLTSQYFANHYLAGMDHWIKEQLRVPGFVRYMDDFVLWGESSRQVLGWYEAIGQFCEDRLGLVLKPPCVNRTDQGLPFLGFVVFPNRLWLSSRSCRKIRRRLESCHEELAVGRISEIAAGAKVRAVLARTDWTAAGVPLRRKLIIEELGRYPRAVTASSAAVAGSTTPATAVRRTATGTSRAIGTTTSASAWSWPAAQGKGRMSSVEPGSDPVLRSSNGSQGKAMRGGQVLVGRVDTRDEGFWPPIFRDDARRGQ